MNISQKDIDEFETAVTKHFSFLEIDFNVRYSGIDTVDEDPRDSYILAKYRQDEFRVNVAWSPFDSSLGVQIRLDNENLGRREKYIYLEPFLEFTSRGAIAPVVPQIFPGLSVRDILVISRRRGELLARGIDESLSEIAKRLQFHLTSIRSASPETVRDYQAWYQSRGKDA